MTDRSSLKRDIAEQLRAAGDREVGYLREILLSAAMTIELLQRENAIVKEAGARAFADGAAQAEASRNSVLAPSEI